MLLSGCTGGVSADISAKNGDISAIFPPTDTSPFPPISDEPSEGDPLLESEPITAPPTEDPLAQRNENTTPPIQERPLPEPQSEEATLSEYDPYIAACAVTNVNVRSGAGTEHPILLTLKKGESLPYLDQTGDWIRVRSERGDGYLYARYAYLAETSQAIERTIHAGLLKIGTPYCWGAPRILNDQGEISPYFTGKSFDCSSFVQYCYYIGCGIKLGNYTGSQADYTVGKKITSYAELKRGDFYFTGNGSISHVVIYLGGGYLLQTYSANGGPVSITTDEKWKAKFISGRRPSLLVTEQFR